MGGALLLRVSGCIFQGARQEVFEGPNGQACGVLPQRRHRAYLHMKRNGESCRFFLICLLTYVWRVGTRDNGKCLCKARLRDNAMDGHVVTLAVTVMLMPSSCVIKLSPVMPMRYPP